MLSHSCKRKILSSRASHPKLCVRGPSWEERKALHKIASNGMASRESLAFFGNRAGKIPSCLANAVGLNEIYYGSINGVSLVFGFSLGGFPFLRRSLFQNLGVFSREVETNSSGFNNATA